jgi:GDPmannose 4,6-dehydratase
MNKTAIISGITGQDGSYLAELLLDLNYSVIGLYRRSSSSSFERISHISNPNLTLEEFDLTDPSSCISIINKYKPDEFYNLAAQSHVGTSFNQPTTTFEIDTIGVINLLESIRKFSSSTRFYQASTSEMFGSNYSIGIGNDKYQNEDTKFLPQSPYAVAKMASHRMIQIYREAYGLYTCSGILFNHESPRRGVNFVTRKITNFIGQLIAGSISPASKLGLGNLDASRDWGHARDYVKGMFLMLQQDEADDFVLSTGDTYTVKEFCEKAFSYVNLNWSDYIFVDPEFYRPCEVNYLKGDSSKARTKLNWTPVVSFEDLVKDMVDSDISKYKAGYHV